MNIAIGICGMMRTYKLAFQNQLANFFLPNMQHNIDLFIITENPADQDNEQHKEEIEEQYSMFPQKTVIVKKHNSKIRVGYDSFREQFVKLDLFLNMIGENNKYDLIVRTRPDIIFEKPVTLQNVDGVQAFAGWIRREDIGKPSIMSMQDILLGSDYESLKLFTDFKEGWQYRIARNPGFYRKRKDGYQAAVQMLMCCVWNDRKIVPIKSGYNIVRGQNNGELVVQFDRESGYFKYSTNTPMIYDKSTVYKFKKHKLSNKNNRTPYHPIVNQPTSFIDVRL
jgi:hypothetical protein